MNTVLTNKCVCAAIKHINICIQIKQRTRIKYFTNFATVSFHDHDAKYLLVHICKIKIRK